MSRPDVFRRIHSLSPGGRLALFVVAAVIILTSIGLLPGIQLSEDIKSMLPDNRKDFSVDFNLLQHTPFMHKVIVNLKARTDLEIKDAIDAADRLAGAMKPPFFTRVITGPEVSQDMDIYNRMITDLPNLATEKDLKDIDADLATEKIRSLLKDDYDSLFSPEGWFLKNFIKTDPLNLKTIGLKKLSSLNIIPNVRLLDNHFVDAEGRNVLVIAETDVDITDAANSKRMIDQLSLLSRDIVPGQIEVSVLSAHSYTVANAETIKADLFIVLTLSSLSVVILYLFFLRSWRTIFIMLISFASFSIALAGVSLIYKGISAITIGFGSALLGLYDEFSLHVYFALHPGSKAREKSPSSIMNEVSRPIIFGGVITLSVFSLLMFSDLPGQRQLGSFAILGVLASLAMSLILLPNMIQAVSGKNSPPTICLKKRRLAHPSIVIGIWIFFIAGCAWQGRHITFNGDLSSINFVPEELRNRELMIKKTWGDLRGQAMVFSEAKDMESALQINDALFSRLSRDAGGEEVRSIAAVMPSLKTQQDNQKAWNAFWSERRDAVRLSLIEEGKAIGFSGEAFDPFFSGLNASPSPVSPEEFNLPGFKEVIDSMITRSDEKVSILTLVPDTPEMKAMVTGYNLPGIRFVSQNHLSGMIREAISRDFFRFIIGAFSVIILLLILLFRNIKKVLLSLVPVVTGMIFMLGVMSWLKMTFNIFNIISAILIIGTAVDYGIFMVCKSSEDYEHDTDTAVLLSGLTTITGIGALIFARHPALYSIGITVLLGISAAIPSAMFVVPAFYSGNKGKQGATGYE